MSLKKQAQGSNKVAVKKRPRSSPLEAKNSAPTTPQTHHASIIQRAGLAPRSLNARDVLQLQNTLGNRATARLLTRTTQSQTTHPKGNTTGLPDKLKAGIEGLSGLSLDDVRVHYNSSEPARLQALAYTRGTDIHVGPSQEEHLPHEAWHVVQQKQGRVRPTLQAKGASINDNKGLEHEADLMGKRALQAGSDGRGATVTTAQEGTTAQRMEATPGLRRTSLSGQSVVQLATTIRFDDVITGNDRIRAMRHDRAAVHQQAVQWVLNNGAWDQVPANAVCNHSRSYATMDQAILDDIQNERLSDAANAVRTIHTSLRNNGQGVGAPTGAHQNRMDNVISHPNSVVNVDDMADTFNYYIYKICDYPRNLFFWPDKTGGNPDKPRGPAGNNGQWQVQDGMVNNRDRLSEEKNRLDLAIDDLDEAFP